MLEWVYFNLIFKSLRFEFQRPQLNVYNSLCFYPTLITCLLFGFSASEVRPLLKTELPILLFTEGQCGWETCQAVMDEGGGQAGI